MKNTLLQIACVTHFALVPALAGATDSFLYEPECAVGTQTKDLQQFHAAVHYPFEHALRFPGLIVGIEKSASDLVRRGAATQNLITSPPGVESGESADKWIANNLRNQARPMFISHVISSSKSSSPKIVYDVYEKANPSPTSLLPSEAAIGPWLDCKRRPVDARNVYRESWDGIKTVKSLLEEALNSGSYSHVLIVMGWNTNQIEAIQNFNSLTLQLKSTAANPNEFNPFVVGVTWPSQWDSSIIEPVVRASSLIVKANDADEIGAGWLGALLRYGVVPVTTKHSMPVITLGHSFGARATSHAICRGTRMQAPAELEAPELAAGAIRWFVNLEAAYSLNRFRRGGAGLLSGVNLEYLSQCPAAERILFTTTKNDTAEKLASKVLASGNFAGSWATFESARNSKSFNERDMPKFLLFKTVGIDGDVETVEGANAAAGSKFIYVDTSSLMRFEALGTGGGAHSDIYRPQIAKMIWKFFEKDFKR